MLHTLRFSLQNAVYFVMLTFLVTVLFKFYIECVLKFKCKIRMPKFKAVRRIRSHHQPTFNIFCIPLIAMFCNLMLATIEGRNM
jgi:hypothetical protein